MRRTPAGTLIIFTLVFLTLACAPARSPDAGQEGARQTQPRPDWERAFTRKSGWTGGDVAASFIIPGNRVLWFFGDSLIAKVKDGRRTGTVLVNNSIAVHPYDTEAPARAPRPEGVRFLWGKDDGEHSAWIDPDEDDDAWYWPAGGGAVVPGDDGDKLVLFLVRIEKTGGKGAWAFRCAGSAIAVIENVEDPADNWKQKVTPLPHRAIIQKDGARRTVETDWGASALPWSFGKKDMLLIYGLYSDKPGLEDLVLARATYGQADDFDEWQFLDDDGQWAGAPEGADLLVKGLPSEVSINRTGTGLLMVYSEPLFGDRIFARTATSPGGPWSDAAELYRVPDVSGDDDLFTYAARGHPHLSRSGRLLVTYIVNTHELAGLADASIYRPRFLSVPMPEQHCSR